jgi:hypothetical protein
MIGRLPMGSKTTDKESAREPALGSLLPIVTGLVALIGAAAYAIMRYSYQQFYDRFGLTPDDVGPSSAAALTQSGIRVATFVALFAILPLLLALAVSQLVAATTHEHRPGIVLELILPVVAALVVYRLFTLLTSGSRELTELIFLAIAVVLLTSKRCLGGRALTRRLPSATWIVGGTLIICGAQILGGSLPRDAKKTAACVIDHRLPVRWVHTHRTFFGIPGLSHVSVLQVRADPAQMFLTRNLAPKDLPSGGPTQLIYLGDSGGRDFVFDLRQRRTLQIPDGTVVVVTRPARHCHWWDYPS